MSLPPANYPNWPRVTLFDDPDEERRVEAMREALRNGSFDEAELYLGTPPGFATLLTDPPIVPRRFDSHGLEDEEDGSGPFDALKRYAALSTTSAPLAFSPAEAPMPASDSDDDAGPFDVLKRLASAERPASEGEPPASEGDFLAEPVAETVPPGERMEPPRAPMESLAEWPLGGTEAPPDMAKELAIMFGPAAALGVSAGLIALWPALVRVAPEARRRLLPFLREHFDPVAPGGEPRPPVPAPRPQDLIALREAYRAVRDNPRGSADDPLVTLTDGDLREVIVERGGFKNINDLEITRRGWGLVKIIWKHGERSAELPIFRVTEDDVVALPEILRTKEPIHGRSDKQSNWVVERPGPDGATRKIVYGTEEFEQDRKRRVVTIYVEDPTVLARQGRDPLPLSPDRGGGRRK